MNIKLDKSSPIPLYYQLAEQIREQINSGILTPGTKLPSEISLSEQVGISRMTVRQAISVLGREGLLEIRPGLGTFVAQPKLIYDTIRLLGFSEIMETLGKRVSSKILAKNIIVAPAYISEALKLDEGEMVFQLSRVRHADGTPLLLESNYVPISLCAGIENADLEHLSFYYLLQQQYGIRLVYARYTLEAVLATEEEARLLMEISTGAPLILARGITFAEPNKPVEYFKVLYRGDRFRFEIESRRVTFLPIADSTRLKVVIQNY